MTVAPWAVEVVDYWLDRMDQAEKDAYAKAGKGGAGDRQTIGGKARPRDFAADAPRVGPIYDRPPGGEG